MSVVCIYMKDCNPCTLMLLLLLLACIGYFLLPYLSVVHVCDFIMN